jgi:hypothetical protein
MGKRRQNVEALSKATSARSILLSLSLNLMSKERDTIDKGGCDISGMLSGVRIIEQTHAGYR